MARLLLRSTCQVESATGQAVFEIVDAQACSIKALQHFVSSEQAERVVLTYRSAAPQFINDVSELENRCASVDARESLAGNGQIANLGEALGTGSLAQYTWRKPGLDDRNKFRAFEARMIEHARAIGKTADES